MKYENQNTVISDLICTVNEVVESACKQRFCDSARQSVSCNGCLYSDLKRRASFVESRHSRKPIESNNPFIQVYDLPLLQLVICAETAVERMCGTAVCKRHKEQNNGECGRCVYSQLSEQIAVVEQHPEYVVECTRLRPIVAQQRLLESDAKNDKKARNHLDTLRAETVLFHYRRRGFWAWFKAYLKILLLGKSKAWT